jgi:thiol:disulfide interchange protein
MLFRNIVFLILVSLTGFAQIEKPTTWIIKATPDKNVKIGDVVEVTFSANIEKGWYLYSSDFDANLGPIVTTVNFAKTLKYTLIGNLLPVHPKKKYDEIWEGEVRYFKEKGKFIQKIKIKEANPILSGTLDFQTCTEVDGKCVNGNEKFTIKITTVETPSKAVVESDTSQAITNSTIKSNGKEEAMPLNSPQKINAEIPGKPAQSLWQFLLIAFGAGLASIFMPCIYPIMPMTVSFFTKQKNGKSKALFYGISIMVIFGLMGLVTMAFGAPFLNFLSTHWIPNFLFFVIFILFGISLLGAFEIVLPHETVNKIDRLGDKGGLIGIFFMALTLVVVSFSCTVPFVGSLLIAAAQGEVTRPIYGMLAFGLPFALVFAGLAMFPQFLKNLPKSGGWLNELKAVFGFLEFALALKFLSNIDLAYHWSLIHRNVFLVIWIVLATIIGLYILGFIRLSKDDKIEKRGALRMFFATVFFALAAYMLPGVTGKPLALLSGILPPITVDNTSARSDNPEMEHLASGIYGFKDLEKAQAYAKETNKPILIDFTGHACANCRKMEENVWPKTMVSKKLSENFVLVSLYVDEKQELPKEKQYTSTYDKQLKTTVGDKNMDLEITKYNNNAQPFYVIVNPSGEKLVEPVGYSNEADFIDFLNRGLSKMKP